MSDVVLCPDPNLSRGKGSGDHWVISWLCWVSKMPLVISITFSTYCKKQKAVWEQATSTLYKIKGSMIKRTILMFYCYVTQIKNSDFELSDVACRLSNKATAERMNTKHYPNWVILIFSHSPTHELYRIKTKGVETNRPCLKSSRSGSKNHFTSYLAY